MDNTFIITVVLPFYPSGGRRYQVAEMLASNKSSVDKFLQFI